jgi:pimeloyl-ACP methyl ester carboxylesterase
VSEASRRRARSVVWPYERIADVEATPPDGPDPYGDPDPAWLRIDWREHLRSIELEGTRVNYAEIGQGHPIVFVHGLSGCWQNWLENMPDLAERGYHALALDLPGFGASPMPPWEVSIPAYGGLVDEFCRALNLHSVTLVGNSMGGFISAEVALRQPEWVERLVLVSAAGISHASMERGPAEATARVTAALGPLSLRIRAASMRRPGIRQLAFQGLVRHPQRMPRELLWEFWKGGSDAPAFLPSVGTLAGYDFLDRLDRIAVPTLIVWGRDDLIVPAADAAGYHRRIADSELVVFAECGHVPMAERPVRFNRLLERFIETPRGEAAERTRFA